MVTHYKTVNQKAVVRRKAFEGKSFSDNIASCLQASKASAPKRGGVKKIQAWKK